VINDIIGRVIGDFSLQVDGKTTEAGVRQALGHDARPVIFDEAESEDFKSSERMQSILDLARVASSGGSIRKGSVTGVAQVYPVRSCFCFSSINTAVHHYADETRFCKLVLKKNEAFDADEHFQDLCRM
jgi:putative DNA primase/helicase